MTEHEVEATIRVNIQREFISSNAKKTYSVQPHCVRFSSTTADGPFTTISTNRVLPFWFNLVFEAMEVCSHNQLARVVDIIVKAENRKIWLVYYCGIYKWTRAKVGVEGE